MQDDRALLIKRLEPNPYSIFVIHGVWRGSVPQQR